VMRCEEVQEYLADRLAGSLSDRLSATVYSHVRTHMLSCPECCDELEDFGEMQKILQVIPVEPCDSNAMRVRFHLLMRKNEVERPRSTVIPVVPRNRPLKVAFISLAAVVVVIAAFLAVGQSVKRISFTRVVPPVSITATLPSSEPATAAVRTGAISGQIRASDPEALRKVRVSVIAVPKSDDRSTEIAVAANTDGKYRLDNIPAGQYYVLARLADGTLYYPGAADIAGATIVSIQPGAMTEGIDFPNIVASGSSTSSTLTAETAEISERVLMEVDVTLRLDAGGRLPYWPDTSIVFTASEGAIRVAASCVVGNLFRASVPANESYSLTISNVAPGYSIQSIVDTRMTDLLHGGLFTASGRPQAPSRIVVTLARN